MCCYGHRQKHRFSWFQGQLSGNLTRNENQGVKYWVKTSGPWGLDQSKWLKVNGTKIKKLNALKRKNRTLTISNRPILTLWFIPTVHFLLARPSIFSRMTLYRSFWRKRPSSMYQDRQYRVTFNFTDRPLSTLRTLGDIEWNILNEFLGCKLRSLKEYRWKEERSIPNPIDNEWSGFTAIYWRKILGHWRISIGFIYFKIWAVGCFVNNFESLFLWKWRD